MTVLPHHPAPRSRFVLRVLAAAACATLVAGCGDRALTTAPQPESSAWTWGGEPPPTTRLSATSPYPLAIGNRWHHLLSVELAIVDSAGNISRLEVIEHDMDREILELRETEGRTYFVQRERATPRTPGIEPSAYVSGLRQDARGLYEWDGGFGPIKSVTHAAATTATPGASALRREMARLSPTHARKLEVLERYVLRAPTGGLGIGPGGGPAAGELYRLRYPLRPRSSWVVRALDFGVLRATVISRGPLRLPAGVLPAWRIRYDWAGVYGPHDVVELWYGELGYLGMHAELRTVMVDPFGNPTGTLITRMEEVLLEASRGETQ